MRKPCATVAIATLLYASAPQAQVEDTPNLKFNGFGTASVVYSDEDQADFVAGTLAPDGAGHTRDWSPRSTAGSAYR